MQYITDGNNNVISIIKSEEEYQAARAWENFLGCLGKSLAVVLVLGAVGAFALYVIFTELARWLT